MTLLTVGASWLLLAQTPAWAARGSDGDPDLTGAGVRIGEIHDLQDLGAPEPTELCTLHGFLRW